MTGTDRTLSQQNTIRLLASARLKPPVLSPLADGDVEFAEIARLESATHGRLRAQSSGLGALSPRELIAPTIPNYSFINAAFAYPRPGGNRFNGSQRGAWYCGFEIETSLAEVSFHLTRALEDAGGTYENTTDYAELLADFSGQFHDLRGVTPRPDCLNPDCVTAYPLGQALASQILAARSSLGIVYPSVRFAAGTCLVALHPYAVQNVRQGALWRLTWSGRPTPSMKRITQ